MKKSLLKINSKNLKRIASDEKDLRIQKLEEELAHLKGVLLSNTQDQEMTTENLQTANIELLSGGEELKSLVARMKTKRELLHNTNEELIVAHQEKRGLNKQLIASQDYAEAMVNAVHEPLVVLDSDLQVKSANKAFYRTFDVSQNDTVGKLIYELGNKQWDIPALRGKLNKILPQGSIFENFEAAWDFPNIGKRTMLLNGQELKMNNVTEKLILVSIEDITERARLRLKEIELLKKFESLLLQAPVAMLVLKGADFIVELANDAYLRIVEKDKAFIGRPVFESLPELVHQGVVELLNGVMNSGEPYLGNELEIDLHRKEQKEKGFYNLVFAPIKDSEGRVTGIMGVVNEITEKVLARKRVEESGYRYRNMIYNSPSLISILKGEKMIIEIANDSIIESWGKGQKIIGKSLFEILPEAVEQGFDQLLLKVYNTGEPCYAYESPITLIRKGKPEQVYYNFVYQAQRDVQGKIEGVAIIANEVTPLAILNKKLRESEFHFRQMANLMPAKIINADITGKVTYYNQNWLDFTGLSFEELNELGYHKILHPKDRKEFKEGFKRALETSTDLVMEIRLRNKNGDYVWHLSISSPVLDENGDFEMWIGITTDISEQIKARITDIENYKQHADKLEEQVLRRTIELKGANDKLQDRNRVLKRMNIELEAFSFGASHDLQEPLRKIQTFVERISNMEGNSITDRSKDYFLRIQQISEGMRQLIEDLLQFSRLGSAASTFIKTDLKKLTLDVLRELRDTVDEKRALFEIGPMVKLKIVPFQFHQVMHNLMGNALKFSKHGVPPYVTIDSRILKGSFFDNMELIPEIDYCHITIRDNGIGFKPEYSEQIFEVFRRLHGKEAYPGTGIGLATVKRIVDNHKGIIKAHSKLNQGARFDIYIPVL